MYETIEEALEELDKILEYVEDINFNEEFHVALEFGHQFKEELQTTDH
jgi:hypothetical protein